jgi:hypothetical protein
VGDARRPRSTVAKAHRHDEPVAQPSCTWPQDRVRISILILKRRLRAARKRAVLAAEDRGTRVARIPQLAAARPAMPTTRLPPKEMMVR